MCTCVSVCLCACACTCMWFLMTDMIGSVISMGYGDLGCFGAPTTSTPNINRMALEGARLTQFYTAHSICTPSRAALLTGRLPVRSGMCGNTYGSKDSSQPMVLWCDAVNGLPLNEITIAESLKTLNYSTMMVRACLCFIFYFTV